MNPAMTGRQRLARTLARQSVDRLPIDLGAHPSTGISAFAYFHLRRHLGLPERPIQVIDHMQMLARVDDDVAERFGLDLRALSLTPLATRAWQPRAGYEFQLPSTIDYAQRADGGWDLSIERPGGTSHAYMPSGGFFFDGDWNGPDLRSWEEQLPLLAAEAKRLAEAGHGVLLTCGLNGFFNSAADFAYACADDPDGLLAEQRASCDRQLAHLRRVIEVLGPWVQVVDINADLGAQRGPLISPAMHRRFCQPFLADLCRTIHEYSDWKVFYHCCGGILPLIPNLIAAGIDILNPVQVAAAGMDPANLAEAFGDKLLFWGGCCDTQCVLGTGTPAEVAANARLLVGQLGSKNGLILNQVHNIMGDVPPENIVAMLDAFRAAAPRSLAAAAC